MSDLKAHKFDRYFASLVFENHYFLMEQSELGPLMTVIGIRQRKPAFEVIQSGNYQISESPLKISVEATQRLAQAAREAGINAELPTFASGILKRAAAAGYENEEVAALIKVLRAGYEPPVD